MVTTERPQNLQDLPILKKLVNAYWGLERINPIHNLLSFVAVDCEGNVSFSNEYYKRFTDPRDDFGTFGWVRYTSALEEELK